MREQRWPWLLGAALLLAAGAAAAWSTYLYWLPCQGSMLSGSILRGYAYGPDFSDACLRRMDSGTPFPFPLTGPEATPGSPELAVAAMVLAGLAWVAIVLGLRWPRPTAVVAVLPSLATFVVATQTAAHTYWVIWLIIDLAALVALIALLDGRPELRTAGSLRIVSALGGATAFGAVPSMLEYLMMVNLSEADWDVPPGTGYLLAAVPVVAAVLTTILTLAPRHRSRGTVTTPARLEPVP